MTEAKTSSLQLIKHMHDKQMEVMQKGVNWDERYS